jgi:hypothetical protein
MNCLVIIKADNIQEFECKAGEVSLQPWAMKPWWLGTNPVVVVDFHGMKDYAKSHY